MSAHSQHLSGDFTFRREIARGSAAAFPMLIGILPFGLLLGAQAAQKGLSVASLALLTGLNFAGGSEFAAIALWTSPPHVLTIVLVSLLVNSRHLVMGASFAPYLNHLPARKVLPALFFMCDESWAMSMADNARRRALGLSPAFSVGYYAGLAGAMWLLWISSTAAGVLIGPTLGDITRWGFDMAFPAVFFVLLKGMWKGFRVAFPWLVSLVTAAAAFHFLPGAAYVPIGALSGLLAIFLTGKKA
ncbi:branched-chain amino acid ABC transporter permease [Mixta theicola]|uniref:Branched-chain amino acid ABC transporter permease n=1 Tax=Mixta theicola TaxID=1458355 RepID=A0A2K1Q8T8_9GAMM|nr:AzlC family ABC transporter permease [Mixta theicola]PNS11449.1 branched-chain amino acid ABC transporter permease [Mixta theicola]GLR10391.1 branched-chain amino acid ABC transporter permease [Mixta theicola]